MAITKKQHRRGGDFNNLDLVDVGSVSVNRDAALDSEVVPKSQAETIAQDTFESNLVTNSGAASLTSAFTSQSMVSFLSAKQDNMIVEAGSTAYIEIVNGNEIRVNQLLVQSVTVDEVSNTLSAYLTANPSHGLQEGDILILTAATVNQQRSWIKNGGAAGDETDFTQLVTDYNEASIRAMFSSADSFVIYDTGNGSFSLNLGTQSTEVGAQTVPVDSTEFNVVNGSTVLAVLKALESYITTVDTNATGGAATLDTRLTSVSGVSGNNMGSFNDSLFPSNATIKQVLEASLAQHLAATADRAAISAAFASADASLQSNIDAEVLRATTAESNEAATRSASDAILQTAINQNSNAINSEATARIVADVALSDRLDIVEGDNTVVGSIERAQLLSNNYTDSSVASEAALRIAADAALDAKIDNLAEGDITFVGQIDASGNLSIRADRIAAGDTRNGQSFTAVDLQAGETFILAVNASITYTDSNTVAYEAGDKLMLVDDIASGSLVEADVNAVPANVTGLSLINIGSSTIEMDGSDDLSVIDDSITRTQLSADVETDIDDKRSLTSNNVITSDSDTHFVTDATTGAAQNVYYKRTSNTSDALTDTKRAVLGELFVASGGSGNALAPSFAHTATFSTHYNGVSVDMSMAIGGGNFEANVTNPAAAVYATGVYALAQSSQLGINSAVTGVAQNAGISNIGITGFGKAGGVGKDRGGVFSLSDLDFINYAGFRSASPISYPDVALIADAATSADGKAFVAVGDSIFEGGTVTVPTPVEDSEAVNLGVIKDKEFSQTLSIPANDEVVINHGLGSKKVMISIWYDDELVTDTFDIDERTASSFKIHNGTTTALVDVEVNVFRLS